MVQTSEKKGQHHEIVFVVVNFKDSLKRVASCRLGRSSVTETSRVRDLETSLREVVSRGERGEKERELLLARIEALNVANKK